jgi:hypothetical protein
MMAGKTFMLFVICRDFKGFIYWFWLYCGLYRFEEIDGSGHATFFDNCSQRRKSLISLTAPKI